MLDAKNESKCDFQLTKENDAVEQINNQIQTLQNLLVNFFVNLATNPIDQKSCETLRNNILALQVSLDSYLSWLKIPNDKNPSLNMYREFLYGKFNKPPEQAVVDLCAELLFLVNSVSIFEDLIKFNSLQDILNSSFEQNLPIEAQKEIALSLESVTTRLLQSGVPDKLLAKKENSSKLCESDNQHSCLVEDIAYKKVKNGIRIDGVNIGGKIVLPNFIEGLPVVRIGANAFAKRQDITALTLPKYLTTIEENAFSFLGIDSIIIPNCVETIGEKAFYNCKKLKTVILSEKLKHIKGHAFEKCESISNISISPGTSYIGDSVFNQCKNLKGIQIPTSVTRMGYCVIPKNTIVYCDNGSRADRYVEEHYGMKKKPFDYYNQDFLQNEFVDIKDATI